MLQFTQYFLVPVTGLYAGLLALIYLVLFGTVGYVRTKTNVSLGDGGDPKLTVANRRHMNFVENVPLALLLLALLELSGASKTFLHVLGTALVVARIVHPFGIDAQNMMRPQRAIGAGLTAVVIAVSALGLIWNYVG